MLSGAGASLEPTSPEPLVSKAVRSLAGMAATPDGGVLLGDKSMRAVLRFDADGRPVGRIRLLQTENQAAACCAAEEFRADQGQLLEDTRIELPPRAIARIDYIDRESSP